ncbi:MAG: putative quinol monooxygenase [Paracoccaceae bacterium]
MSENVLLSGTITCTAVKIESFRAALVQHVKASRAEPGCLDFEITPSPHDPLVFEVAERFVDRAAFEAHTTRTRASRWWRETAGLARDLTVRHQ